MKNKSEDKLDKICRLLDERDYIVISHNNGGMSRRCVYKLYMSFDSYVEGTEDTEDSVEVYSGKEWEALQRKRIDAAFAGR